MSTLRFTQISEEYVAQIVSLLNNVFYYTPVRDRWDEDDIQMMVDLFPEGSFVAIDSEIDRIVGVGLGIILELDFDSLPAREDDLLYQDGKVLHDPLGSFYYGTDLAVAPAYRGLRIARKFYNLRKEVVVRMNKRGFVAGAEVPGYENEKHRMKLETYIEKVVSGDIFDPTLSVQLRNGFKVIRALKNYFYHEETDHSAALIYWENEQFVPE